MSWEDILKKDLTNQVKEALLLWYKDEEDLYDSNLTDEKEVFTEKDIPNLIEDLKFAMGKHGDDPREDVGLPKAIKALERLQ